jgi:predicted lactoylglutathione lyase
MDQRISLVTLGVADLTRAKAFYERLGWVDRSPDPSVVFFQAGGMILALWGRADLAVDSAVQDNGGWGGVALAHNVGSRAEVDALVAEAREAGATVTREPGETFYGGYAGVIVDPDGHPWEIAHNPGFALADDGTIALP